MNLLAKDEDLRYMALKGYIDSNWQNVEPIPTEDNSSASSDEERVVLMGLHDTSVLIQDLASTSLIQSFCKCKDIAAVYTLFHSLLNDMSLPCTRGLKTLLVSTSAEGRPVSVSLENVTKYCLNLVEHQHLMQSIHWDVFIELINHYSELKPLDSLFLQELVPLNPPDNVIKAVVPHLSRSLISNYNNFDAQQLLMISESYPHKFTRDKANSILTECVDQSSDVSLEKVKMCYNLFWFWYTQQGGVPTEILNLLDRFKNITKDEGDLNDASDSDEFDISLSEDEDSVPMYEETQTGNGNQEEVNEVISQFESLISSASSFTQQHQTTTPSSQITQPPRLYSEILVSTPADSEELLETWLKEYQDYDLNLTKSIIDQILESEFTLFQWQWLITMASRLPTDAVVQFLPRSVTFLKPMKRFVQVIQVGNLKQRQDDALNLRLQLWSLIDSLLNFDDPLNLDQVFVLTLIIPYLQYGLKDCVKDSTFQPVLLSILDKLKDHCSPLIITNEPLLQSLEELNQEQHPWIIPTINSIKFKML